MTRAMIVRISAFALLLTSCSGSGGGGPVGGEDPVAPPPPPPPAPLMGAIEVTTATSGIDVDPDGYDVLLPAGGRRAVGINETVLLNDIEQGPRQVTLTDVAANCTVTGENPRTINVVAGATARTTFEVACSEIPRLSFDAITGKWSGIVTETQPCCEFVYRVTYTLEVEAPIGEPVGAYAVGDAAPFGVEGILVARSADGDLYVVDEKVTKGMGWLDAEGVQLTHDPAAETLSYKWVNPVHPLHGSTAILERTD